MRLNFLLGISYLLSGYLGSLISVPPSHASPVWPAAGVALAGIVAYGWRVLPGIWLGAFLIQSYTFLSISSPQPLFSSLVIGAIVSTAATLQAGLGAWLIKRCPNTDLSLIDDGSILRFLALGGPISCTLSASIGMAALFLGGVATVDDFGFGWLTWWSGDTIGVLIFTPLLLCFIGEPKQRWRARINSVALPLILLLLLVTTLFYFGKSQEEKRIATLFNERANLLHNALQNEFDRTIDINQTLKAFWNSSSSVTSAEFNIFSQTLLRIHKNIQALEWIPRITTTQQPAKPPRNAHPPEVGPKRQANLSGNDQFLITYLEPYQGNERALGFDIGTNPIAYKAIQTARTKAQTALTEKLRLVQDLHNNPAVVAYTPIYTDARQAPKNLRGFVASVLVVSQKVNEVKNQFDHLQLSIHITAGADTLFEDTDTGQTLDLDFPKLEKTLRLQVADRLWNITYTANPQFYSGELTWSIWWLILGSLLLVSLIGAGLLMLTGRTMQTEGIVKLRTGELQQEIAERQKILSQRNDHNKVLKAIVSTSPLLEVLELITEIAERAYPGSVCSVMLLDATKQHLYVAAAPHLPEFYNRAINGIPVKEGVGSCGTAAYRRERVIMEDIREHPYWQAVAGQLAKAGLASCWSEPIFSSKTDILGTFAIYYPEPHYPSQDSLALLQELAQLASIAIEKKSSEEQIIHLAFFDSLTNLPNRRLFLDKLEQAISKVSNHPTGSALLYLDLDHFKTLNDSLGHDIGDELLKQVAHRLKECVTDDDTVARLGGDEFVLLLNGASSGTLFDRALTVAEQVQALLLAPYQLKTYVHHISSSIGITLLEHHQATAKEVSPGELLKQADTAMYHAKQRGRNAISFYNEAMQLRANQRLLLEQDMRSALTEGQFQLHFQPQFDNAGQLIGAEALLRWRHPEQGMLSPADFIPVAEETGLILAISEWVLRTACQQLQKWPKLPHMAINICPKEFHHAQFETNIIAILNEYHVPASRLMLEITESIIIDNMQESILKLQTLKNQGIKIAIDDFGTGYSSLYYLKVLPISQLKIDQSFIRDIGIDANDTVIVETIIAMARHLGLSVIAEGVANAGQLQFLIEQQCNGYQGYYFSKPLSEQEFAGRYFA